MNTTWSIGDAQEPCYEFNRGRQFASNSGLRCRPAARDWDYVCSYMPTPLQSTTRLEFGVTVDEKGWLKASPVVPAGTDIAPPR